MALQLGPRKIRFSFTRHHDEALLEQVQALNPFAPQPDQKKPNEVWKKIALTLQKSPYKMNLTYRTCKDRAHLLLQRLAQFHCVDETIILGDWLKDLHSTVLVNKLREWQSVQKLKHTSEDHGGTQHQGKDCDCGLSNCTDTSNSNSNSNFAATFSSEADPLLVDTGDDNGNQPLQPNDLYSQVVAIDTKLERWTKHQDAVNQEILHQLKELRQDVRNNYAFPNPYVRLERLPSPPPPPPPPKKARWRNTTRTRRRPHQKTVRKTMTTTSATKRENTETVLADNTNSQDVMDYNDPDSEQSKPEACANANVAILAIPIIPEVIVKVEAGSPSHVDAEQERLDLGLEDFLATTSPSPQTPTQTKGDEAGERRIRTKTKAKVTSFLKPGPKTCDLCPTLTFKNVLELYAHRRQVHGGRAFVCQTCGKMFTRGTLLRLHQLIHSEERLFKCQYCDHTCRQPQGLYLHERSHLLGTKYGRAQCAQCGQLFVNAHNMRMHVKEIHQNIRAHACHLCEKRFKKRPHLNYHLRTHQNPGGRQRGLNREPPEDSQGGAPITRIKRVGGIPKLKLVSDMDLDGNGIGTAIVRCPPVPVSPTTTTTTSQGSLIS